MFERGAALAAFDGGRPTEAMWMRWATAKLAALHSSLDERTRMRIAGRAVADIVTWAFLEDVSDVRSNWRDADTLIVNRVPLCHSRKASGPTQ